MKLQQVKERLNSKVLQEENFLHPGSDHGADARACQASTPQAMVKILRPVVPEVHVDGPLANGDLSDFYQSFVMADWTCGLASDSYTGVGWYHPWESRDDLPRVVVADTWRFAIRG